MEGKSKLTPETVAYLIERLLNNYISNYEEKDEIKEKAFWEGKQLAYFEMLDILKTELGIYEQDLKDYGLDIDLYKYL